MELNRELFAFLHNISNKEIIIEVLHHSIDYLIENKDEQQTLKLCHKYGFSSPDEFMLVTKTLAKHYRNCCIENYSTEAEFSSEFGVLKGELKRLVPMVLEARKPEIMRFLLRWHNAQDQQELVESFDWDLRMIMGDSSYAQNERLIATCTFNCRKSNRKTNILHFQMDLKTLNEMIQELEKATNDLEQNIISTVK